MLRPVALLEVGALMGNGEERTVYRRLARALAERLGPHWRSVGLFASEFLPCRCVSQRAFCDSVHVAYAVVRPGVWLIHCGACERRYAVAFVGESGCPSQIGGCKTPELQWYGVGPGEEGICELCGATIPGTRRHLDTCGECVEDEE